MSAYVNRLLNRFSPSQANTMTAAEPIVRSHSPIAEFDQRPGSEDSFELEPAIPSVSPNLEAPSPARIHRKAVAQPLASSPAPLPAPAVAPTPTSRAPSIAAPTVAPPTPTSAPVPAVSSPTQASEPRREPLDPGPLFDIFPRYFDTSEPAPASNQPRIVEGPSEPISTPAKPKPRAFEVEATPRRISPAPQRELELRSPTIEAPPRPAPWVPTEPTIPGSTPSTTPLANPTKPDRRALPSPTRAPEPSPAPLHYATPRTAAPAPYVPDPGSRPGAEPSANARSRVHIGRVEIEVIPSNPPSPAQSGAAAPKQKLSIDSISQIGPLGQYFSSRRLLRLRYR